MSAFQLFCNWKSKFETLRDAKSIKIMLSIGWARNSIISELMDKVTTRLTESGISMFLHNRGINNFYPITIPSRKEKKPKVLSFYDLEYGFLFWVIAAIISTVIFVCELNALFAKKQFRKLCHFLLFKTFFHAVE